MYTDVNATTLQSAALQSQVSEQPRLQRLADRLTEAEDRANGLVKVLDALSDRLWGSAPIGQNPQSAEAVPNGQLDAIDISARRLNVMLSDAQDIASRLSAKL